MTHTDFFGAFRNQEHQKTPRAAQWLKRRPFSKRSWSVEKKSVDGDVVDKIFFGFFLSTDRDRFEKGFLLSRWTALGVFWCSWFLKAEKKPVCTIKSWIIVHDIMHQKSPIFSLNHPKSSFRHEISSFYSAESVLLACTNSVEALHCSSGFSSASPNPISKVRLKRRL